MEERVSEIASITTKQLLETMDKVGDQPIGLGNAADLVGKKRTFDFTFEYMDFIFAVKATAENHQTHMRFHANLGYIPFTCEGAKNRSNVIGIVNQAGTMLGGKVHISPQQRIMLAEDFWFDQPLTPSLLMTKTVQLLIKAKPYLGLLAESVNKPLSSRGFTRKPA